MESVGLFLLGVMCFVVLFLIGSWFHEVLTRGPVVAAWMAYYEGFTYGEIKRVHRSDVLYANRSHAVPTVMNVKIGERPRTILVIGTRWTLLGGEPIYQEYRLVPETAHVIWKITGETPHKS